MKRSPMRRQADNRRASLVEFSADVRTSVRSRAFARCEVLAPGCRGGIHHFHHRLLRSHGGTGTIENCLGVCGPCHNAIHANPDWAYRHGLLVRSLNDPIEVQTFVGCSPGCDYNHAGQ
jgi:hypothetical protein